MAMFPAFFFSYAPISKKKKEKKKCRKRGYSDTHHYLYHVYLNWAANVYLFLYFFNFLSLKSQIIKFLSHFSVRPTKLKLQSSADSRRAVVSYWRKNGHQVLVNCIGGLPRNSVAKLTDRARNDLKCAEGP